MKNKGLLILLFLLFLLPACRGQKQESVATVNGSPILLKDFQNEIILAGQRDPSLKMNRETIGDVLETMIDRKLMVQEAVKKGMSEDERFVETIKRFWEQTLIRQLIEAKAKNWADRLQVSDDDVTRYYERMGYKVTLKLINRPDEDAAGEARAKLLKGEAVEGGEIIGPLMVENIWSGPLLSSFDQAPGEVTVSRWEKGYAVIQVIKKEKTAAPPFKDVSGRIKETLSERKKQHALEEWLLDLKKSSNISVDADTLKRVQDERK